ncbi:MAG: AI-2E family transporter [Ardenticatenaceae bacterium]|nr:AI-2E family transporter [Anaerolineales bacterium]MCB8917720.1 AI-2E family transporter [Ardenticatenaceae bacterium]
MMKSLTPFSLLLLLLGTVGIVAFILISAPLWPALLVAALLAYLLNPVVNLLEKRLGGRRNLAVILIYTVSILILAGFVSAVGALIVGRVPAWSLELGDALIEMEQWLERPFILLGFTIEPQALLNYAQQIGASGVAAIPAVPGGLLGGIADNLLWSLVILISLYYLMRDGRDIAPSLVRLLPPAYQAETNALLADIDNVWRVFLRVQLLIFIILGVLLVLSTTLLLWFFRRGWLPLSPVGLVILLVLVYAAIQQIDNLWLRPQYMGHALKLHPGVVVVALLAALVLTGVLGALVIVPTLATLKILAEFFYDRWLPKIAEPRPGPPPEQPADPPQ